MDISKIPLGTPESFNTIVEISQGSSNKYEMDADSGFLKLDYVFRDGFSFLTNYGFIPHTLGGDGDPLDVMILASYPILPLTVVLCKPIAMLELIDRGEEDNKLIVVPYADSLADQYNSLGDLSEEQIRGFEDFFREIGIQRNKIMEIIGFHDKERAIAEIKKSIRL